jgi:hypothetical protein
MNTLSQENIKKTYFGVVTDISEIFERFLYCHDATFHPDRGSLTPRPEGFYFCPGRGTTVETWLNWGKPRPKSGNLSVKPTYKVATAVLKRSMEGKIGGFQIIPWEHAGHALIIGSDSTGIASVWLAFIPLDKLPTINQDNTPIWDGKADV